MWEEVSGYWGGNIDIGARGSGKEVESKGKIFLRFSHQGILAIHSHDKKHIIQFTDLRDREQVEVGVEDYSNIVFYDGKMVLLTYDKPLREARVEEVFDEHDISAFKRIGDVDRVDPYTDASLVHSRRILCYRSIQLIPYEFNVDTGENKRIEIGQRVNVFSSLMGIDCGIKAVFQDYDNKFTYTLGWDNNVTPLYEAKREGLTSIFVSSTRPKDLSKNVLKYFGYLIEGGNRIDPREPIHFESNHSVIRIYKDAFLLYNWNTEKWVLSRIIVS